MEPKQGEYDWSAMDKMVRTVAEKGGKVLWVMQCTPSWSLPKTERSPISWDPRTLANMVNARNRDAYRRFLTAFWDRYGSKGAVCPGVVGAIECWNETNVDGWTYDWSNPKQMGEDYANFVQDTVEITRAKAPKAKVIGLSMSSGQHYEQMETLMDGKARNGKTTPPCSTPSVRIPMPKWRRYQTKGTTACRTSFCRCGNVCARADMAPWRRGTRKRASGASPGRATASNARRGKRLFGLVVASAAKQGAFPFRTSLVGHGNAPCFAADATTSPNNEHLPDINGISGCPHFSRASGVGGLSVRVDTVRLLSYTTSIMLFANSVFANTSRYNAWAST
jgi:hypothetical protein